MEKKGRMREPWESAELLVRSLGHDEQRSAVIQGLKTRRIDLRSLVAVFGGDWFGAGKLVAEGEPLRWKSRSE